MLMKGEQGGCRQQGRALQGRAEQGRTNTTRAANAHLGDRLKEDKREVNAARRHGRSLCDQRQCKKDLHIPEDVISILLNESAQCISKGFRSDPQA